MGLLLIAENQLCDEHKFMILTHFVQHDNLHRWTPCSCILKYKWNPQRQKAIVRLSSPCGSFLWASHRTKLHIHLPSFCPLGRAWAGCLQLSSTSICEAAMPAALKFHATLQLWEIENEKENNFSCQNAQLHYWAETSTVRNFPKVNLDESRCCSWPFKTSSNVNIIRDIWRRFQALCGELTLEEEEEEILRSFHVGHCEQV